MHASTKSTQTEWIDDAASAILESISSKLDSSADLDVEARLDYMLRNGLADLPFILWTTADARCDLSEQVDELSNEHVERTGRLKELTLPWKKSDTTVFGGAGTLKITYAPHDLKCTGKVIMHASEAPAVATAYVKAEPAVGVGTEGEEIFCIPIVQAVDGTSKMSVIGVIATGMEASFFGKAGDAHAVGLKTPQARTKRHVLRALGRLAMSYGKASRQAEQRAASALLADGVSASTDQSTSASGSTSATTERERSHPILEGMELHTKVQKMARFMEKSQSLQFAINELKAYVFHHPDSDCARMSFA